MEPPKPDLVNVERSKEPLAEFDHAFKIILVGETGVGKTCLIKRTEEDKFEESHTVTIGGDFSKIYYWINRKQIKLQLWDTCGLEQYRSMVKIFFKGSDACLIVFDLSSEGTFYAIPRWLADVRENTSPTTKIYLVGNKCDLENHPVPYEAISSYVSSAGINGYFEVSAKTGKGIEKLFKEILSDIFVEQEKAAKPAAEVEVKAKALQNPDKHRGKHKKKDCC